MSWWWVLVFLAVLLIGVTKSGFGSGVGLMIVPMTAIAMGNIPGRDSETALGLLLPLLIFGDLLAVWQYRKLFWQPSPAPVDASAPARDSEHTAIGLANELPNPDQTAPVATSTIAAPPEPRRRPAMAVIGRLLPGTIVGVVIGGLLLYWFHQQKDLVGALIRIEIGLESILLVSLHWWRLWRGVQTHLMGEPWRSHVTGGFAAVSSTLAHAAGPIIAMYLLPLRMDRQLYVGTCALYFFLLNSAKLPAYYESGMFRHAQLGFTIQFLPLVVAGALLGLWINKRMSDKLFTKIVYAVTFGLGWYILFDGVRMLVARHG